MKLAVGDLLRINVPEWLKRAAANQEIDVRVQQCDDRLLLVPMEKDVPGSPLALGVWRPEEEKTMT